MSKCYVNSSGRCSRISAQGVFISVTQKGVSPTFKLIVENIMCRIIKSTYEVIMKTFVGFSDMFGDLLSCHEWSEIQL